MSYKMWCLVTALSSLVAEAQPSDRNQTRAWPYGPYDKNIPIRRQVSTNRPAPPLFSGSTNSTSTRPIKNQNRRTNAVQSGKPEKTK